LFESKYLCRKEFVDLYVNYTLNESVRKPFEDFMRGFLRGCPVESWKIFLPDELQVVLMGPTNYDWHLLKKVSVTSRVAFCCYAQAVC